MQAAEHAPVGGPAALIVQGFVQLERLLVTGLRIIKPREQVIQLAQVGERLGFLWLQASLAGQPHGRLGGALGFIFLA